MPLRFPNSAAQAFFWIFVALFAVAAVAALFFSYRRKQTLAELIKAASMLFLGTAMVCLLPSAPLIWFSCYLLALCALGQAKRTVSLNCIGLGLLAASQCLNIAVISGLLTYQIPVYVYILAAVAVLAGLTASLFVPKKWNIKAFLFDGMMIFPAIAMIFAALLLADGLLYSKILLLVGYLFFVGVSSTPDKSDEEHKLRSYYKNIFYFLGQFLIYIGLVLSVTVL